ncbi:MAG: DUF898 family protein [Gammaproteobacteria bacterium]|nr:DUF898 family protein [Gammaproteobacteria bacterium]
MIDSGHPGSSEVESTTKQQTSIEPFTFHGNGSDYFRIWIVNMLFTILTLGIYSAWAKVRSKRYFGGNRLRNNISIEYVFLILSITFLIIVTLGFFYPWSAVAVAVVTDEGLHVSVDREKLQVSSPLPGTPTRMEFGGKESFVTEDGEGVERLRGTLALTPGLANRVERHMPAVVAAAALVISMLAVLAFWGVPALAARLALTVPEEVSAQVSGALMSQLDVFLDPSSIAPERRRELERYFRSHGEVETIEFREAGIFGANAVTLGATMIAFSDELVELAESDEELLAVYFHELGHARLRHVEQNVFRASAWLVLITVLTGDIGAVGELLVGLPLLSA